MLLMEPSSIFVKRPKINREHVMMQMLKIKGVKAPNPKILPKRAWGARIMGTHAPKDRNCARLSLYPKYP